MSSPNYLFLISLILSFLHYTSQLPIGPKLNTIPPSLLSSLLSSSSSVQKFINVVNFGARNDGKNDATQAFLNAWNVACTSRVPTIIYVPKGQYLVRPLRFEGNCKNSNMVLQIDGTLVAPDDFNEIANSSSWILFHKIDGLQIKGGVIDAKGKSLWDCKTTKKCDSFGAKSLSFDNSKNIVIDGLTSINSQMFHISINACQKIKLTRIRLMADANSPNTDGIHLARSIGVTIMDSDIRTGDDCISIGPNNIHIWIERIHCGPGHGISIGSLGRDTDEGQLVQDVMVKSVSFTGTDNGLRIKTFSTPVNGMVKDIFFLGAQMENVLNPIIIDQKYCPHNTCINGQGSNIQISNVVFRNIQGTSASEVALKFNCSPKKPCVGLTLQDIKLSYLLRTPQCHFENAYGKAFGFMQPSKCLGN